MPWFEGSHTETRALGVSVDTAVAHFGDLAAIVAATHGVERSEIDGRTVHFVMKEEDYGVLKFQADYRCTYEIEGDTVRWDSAEGNLKQTGQVRFAPDPAGSGCTMEYSETIQLDLPVPAMMAPVLNPVIEPMVAKEIGAFVDRMVQGL